MFVPQWSIAAVVTQKKDESVFGNSQCFQMVEQVAERFVHSFNE